MVVVLGIDVHKGTHTTVAADECGRVLAERTVRATDAGHEQLILWARRGWPRADRLWAVEDCRHVSGRLERALLAAGERVVRVPPKLMAGVRRSARTRGKSDPIDALAIARAALREPDLPVAAHDAASREVKPLVDHREDLVNTRTQVINRLRWHLHDLDPELDLAERSLDRYVVLDRVAVWLADKPDTVQMQICRELIADITALTRRANAIEGQLTKRTALAAAMLRAVSGCGALTAAKIIGETANVTRFRSEACFAMHAGVAPIPASSGKTDRHRLARGGNRQLDVALHRIAVTQIRLPGPRQDYYRRRRSDGDTPMEALRALKRRLARIVYNQLQPTSSSAIPAAA
ncbi:MAG: IS110 family transposase [Sporichthyaceae bacterium]|nr:IS110 family transposase [Sporichthyaceae bacterium]